MELNIKILTLIIFILIISCESSISNETKNNDPIETIEVRGRSVQSSHKHTINYTYTTGRWVVNGKAVGYGVTCGQAKVQAWSKYNTLKKSYQSQYKFEFRNQTCSSSIGSTSGHSAG